MLDIFQKLIPTFAIFAGGFWLLMNTLRNGTNVPILQVGVEAEIVRRGDLHFITATCQAKNVGRSVIKLMTPKAAQAGLPGNALIVRLLRRFAPGSQIVEAPWDADSVAFDIFSNQQSIEPGLTISEQKLICQPDLSCDAAWVQLRVSAHDETWSAVAVAVLNDDARTSVSLAPAEQNHSATLVEHALAAAPQAIEQKRARQKLAGGGRPRRGQENRGIENDAEAARRGIIGEAEGISAESRLARPTDLD